MSDTRRGCWTLTMAGMAVLLFSASQAAEQQVVSMDIHVVGQDRAQLGAQVDFTPNDQLVEALRGEQSLAFNFEVKVAVVRPYWFDIEYSTLRWDAHLIYDNVLNTFQVITFNGNESVARDMKHAFEILGDVKGLEMIGNGLGDVLQTDNTSVSARFEVDVDRLPSPMRIAMLSSLDWNFSTGWRVWPSSDLLRLEQ